MDVQFSHHDSYVVGLHFAMKIIFRHLVISLDLNGEALARDLEANADVLEQRGTGDAIAEASSKIAADVMQKIAEAARKAEAERVSAARIQWIDP